MRHEIAVLYNLYDKTRSVVDALLEGLKKPPQADPKKFSLEARKLMFELSALIHGNFVLKLLEGSQLPSEYRQVALGLAQAVGLPDRRIVGFREPRENEVLRYMEVPCMDLQALVEGKQNHSDDIRRIARICGALALECRIACVVPEEVVLNEVDIGAVIHVESP